MCDTSQHYTICRTKNCEEPLQGPQLGETMPLQLRRVGWDISALCSLDVFHCPRHDVLESNNLKNQLWNYPQCIANGIFSSFLKHQGHETGFSKSHFPSEGYWSQSVLNAALDLQNCGAPLLPQIWVKMLVFRAFPSDGLRRYVLSIPTTTSGGSQPQMPLKQGSNRLPKLMSRRCPFSSKTNPHLQIPGDSFWKRLGKKKTSGEKWGPPNLQIQPPTDPIHHSKPSDASSTAKNI